MANNNSKENAIPADNTAEFKSNNIVNLGQSASDSKETRNIRIANFSNLHNTYAYDTASMETKLEDDYLLSMEIEEAIAEKRDELKSSGSVTITGQRKKLSGFEKTKTRNEIKNLEKTRAEVKTEISQLERSLSSAYRKDNKRLDRSRVRKRAKSEGYHQRYGEDIEKAMRKYLGKFSSEDRSSLKNKVAEADANQGNAAMMKSLLKAPRNLHTRIVINAEARERYLNYFRQILLSGNEE